MHGNMTSPGQRVVSRSDMFSTPSPSPSHSQHYGKRVETVNHKMEMAWTLESLWCIVLEICSICSLFMDKKKKISVCGDGSLWDLEPAWSGLPDQFSVHLIFDIENYVLDHVSLLILDDRKLGIWNSEFESLGWPLWSLFMFFAFLHTSSSVFICLLSIVSIIYSLNFPVLQSWR